jgi:hypothetical protein
MSSLLLIRYSIHGVGQLLQCPMKRAFDIRRAKCGFDLRNMPDSRRFSLQTPTQLHPQFRSSSLVAGVISEIDFHMLNFLHRNHAAKLLVRIKTNPFSWDDSDILDLNIDDHAVTESREVNFRPPETAWKQGMKVTVQTMG